ncbi:MAG: arginase family protein, partial [Planctomycetota bacterium]|nr:arginase family protein [Planctomycetota bacterium]
ALDAGVLPIVLGGDHSAPLGAMRVCAERHPGLGVLHFDAHADLRDAFEGLRYSHASILFNLLEETPEVARLVQVGIRDLGEAERGRIDEDPRITALFDPDWARAKLAGDNRRVLIREHLDLLPQEVYLTFDVDGLDPSLCPNTGTPVPGGFDWHEAMLWLEELVSSGRRVVGCDLCEVSPGPAGDPDGQGWDAIVGSRLLYRMLGAALATRR